jgi:hypothetical protein
VVRALQGTSQRESRLLPPHFDDARKEARISQPLKQLPFGKVFAIEGAAGQPCYLVQLAADRPSRQVESRS